jgi:hypothetical protein
MKTYLDFEIQIGAQDAGLFSVSVSGPGGEARGLLRLPIDNPDYAALAARLQRLDTDELTLVGIGQFLFDALFQGPVRDVYTRSQGALSEREGLRLRLHIAPGAAQVVALPWELLYDPDQGPLALLDTPIVRFLPQQDKLPSMAAPLPLRVLLTAAQTPPAVDVERELAAAQEALSAMADRVQVTVEPHLTTARFQSLLRSGFHVWHFVGHGGFARDGATGQLLFEDASGDAEAVSALQIGIMVNRSGLRLVVLDACSSAQVATDPFRSIAPALIRAQVPAIVAMQFKVPEEATAAFASEFYRALTEGLPIDGCVTEGRRAVMNVSGLGRADWGIPVVYTRAQDGRLFDAPAAAPLPPVAPTATPASAPIGEGLDALRDLMETTNDVRESVVSFRTDFEATRTQIEILGTYKDIHDQLHSLQIHCFNCVVLEARRTSVDDIAWDTLSNYELTLQGIVDRLREIATSTQLAPSELAWNNDLAQARVEMAMAIETLDIGGLKRATRLLNRVLTIQPAQINARLSAAARTLRLLQLASALKRIEGSMASIERDSDKVQQFERAVAVVAQLGSDLRRLVSDHDQHQLVDLELRRIETLLDQDLSELELSWPDLKAQANPLYQASEEPWAVAVRSEADRLDTALASSDPVKIRHFFRRFRRQMGDRFYRVDIDLKRLCDDLRKVGEPLSSLLQMIA